MLSIDFCTDATCGPCSPTAVICRLLMAVVRIGGGYGKRKASATAGRTSLASADGRESEETSMLARRR